MKLGISEQPLEFLCSKILLEKLKNWTILKLVGLDCRPSGDLETVLSTVSSLGFSGSLILKVYSKN